MDPHTLSEGNLVSPEILYCGGFSPSRLSYVYRGSSIGSNFGPSDLCLREHSSILGCGLDSYTITPYRWLLSKASLGALMDSPALYTNTWSLSGLSLDESHTFSYESAQDLTKSSETNVLLDWVVSFTWIIVNPLGESIAFCGHSAVRSRIWERLIYPCEASYQCTSDYRRLAAVTC